MKSSMAVKVEFLAGTNIEDAVKEAKEMASKLDVAYVQFNFNGVSFSIGQNADIDKVLARWRADDTQYGICAA